jgi:hypothetical protein
MHWVTVERHCDNTNRPLMIDQLIDARSRSSEVDYMPVVLLSMVATRVDAHVDAHVDDGRGVFHRPSGAA